MKNGKGVLTITEDMLNAANISTHAGLTITSLNKAVVITESDVLELVPPELLDLFGEFGISETAVRNVLSEENGILEALAVCQQ